MMAGDIAKSYLLAAGGDADRALQALAGRALWLAVRASGGLMRKPADALFVEDCEELARETAFLAMPFEPEEPCPSGSMPNPDETRSTT